jgi:hypothetical protein
VNIISIELRFRKKINYYKPTIFSHDGIKTIEIELSHKQQFTSGQIFNLPYKKQSENKEAFLLHYQLEEQSMMIINIQDPKGKNTPYNINEKDGYISFSFDKGGQYKITFNSNNLLYNNLNNNDKKEIKGTFDIISTEYPLEINIKENNFSFEEIKAEGSEIDSLKFNITSLDKDYIKKITIGNKDFFEIKDIASIKKGDEEYKSLNSSYYLFDKNVNYQLKIKFNKKNENSFIFEKFNIKDYSLDNIGNLSLGDYLYNDTNDKFLIINLTDYKNIKINVTNKNTKFFKSKINENQIKDLVKEFQNIKFEKLENLLISKPSKIIYEVLMIELKENNTLISFIGKENNEEEKDGGKESGNKNNKGKAYIYVIVATISILIILIVIFFIIRHFRREKASIDYVSTLKEEKLMSEI